ncbi:MAG: hypothetical protein ACLP6G_04280 [Terriglobales bacterium]
MARRLHLLPWSTRQRSAAAFLLAISLTSCTNATRPDKPSANLTATELHAVNAQAAPAHDSKKHIVLPNPALAGCKTENCTQVLPDKIADHDAIYPWQVLVDFNGSEVIGLIAFYDQPTSIDDLQAAVDERYGKWAEADFRTGCVRIWRVEPEHFVIQLSVASSGMVQLIYLTFDANHPASDQAVEYYVCVMEKSAKCAAHRRSTSWAPDFLR